MKKILIVSVLKPVNDTRSYGKIGMTLAETGRYEVHIAGFRSSESPAKKVKFYPLFKFKRLSLQRIFAPVKILMLMIKLKPSLVIASTHELLAVSVLFKLFTGCRIIYDIQENYYRNILYMNVFPAGIREILGYYTKINEWFWSLFFNGFLLAERCYHTEISWLGKRRFIVLENKIREEELKTCKKTGQRFENPGNLKLLYSGTVSVQYGVMEAINLAQMLVPELPDLKLKIIGICRDSVLLARIREIAEFSGFLQLTISEEPVPNSEILEAQQETDFLLLPYRINKAVKDRIPTRLFEGLAMHLPMIIQRNPSWENLCDEYSAAIFTDYNNIDISSVIHKIKTRKFYIIAPGVHIYWNAQERKLVEFIDLL